MNDQEKKAIDILEKYNQHHIVEHLKKIDENQKQEIIKQIEEIDFEEVLRLYNNTKKDREKRETKIEPLQTLVPDQMNEEQKNEYEKEGKNIIRENKFAVVTMAGGQGTRLRA